MNQKKNNKKFIYFLILFKTKCILFGSQTLETLKNESHVNATV